jgi:RNA polymerase sigma-70 factor, ECF subfamily
LEAVYQDNVGRIYRWMRDRVGNRSDAEDLAAEVFLAALRPLRLSGSVGEVRSYLSATARTVLAGHLRRTVGREVTFLDGDTGPGGWAAGQWAANQWAASQCAGSDWTGSDWTGSQPDGTARTRAQEILAALPERYRRILELRFLGSCSVREAAAELGVSVGHAKVLQHRALRHAATVGGPA